ncbi:uncharacterized protein MELLADRAFT_73747, partial [Melampsora larici-populina 98AG31]
MLLVEFATRLNDHHPQLAKILTLPNLIHFVNLASEVYQRANKALKLSSVDTRIIPFLHLALSLPIEIGDYEALWNLTFASLPAAHNDPVALIRTHGLDPSLKPKVYEKYFIPPISQCFKCNRRSAHSLVQRPRRNGYLYDLDGIHSAEFHTWACLDCKTYYRPSYYTHEKVRHYYTPDQGMDPLHYQVHCHFGFSHRLAQAFWQSQMLGHTSHFNLVNLFNLTYFNGQQVPKHPEAVSISPKISQELVRDALDLFS